jgi:signal transduction histidine kinase
MADQGLDLQRRTVTAIEQMSLGIVAGNERIAALIAAHTQHVNFTFGAHVELKERLDDISEQIIYKKRLDDLEKGLKDTQDKIKAVPKGDKDL